MNDHFQLNTNNKSNIGSFCEAKLKEIPAKQTKMVNSYIWTYYKQSVVQIDEMLDKIVTVWSNWKTIIFTDLLNNKHKVYFANIRLFILHNTLISCTKFPLSIILIRKYLGNIEGQLFRLSLRSIWITNLLLNEQQ